MSDASEAEATGGTAHARGAALDDTARPGAPRPGLTNDQASELIDFPIAGWQRYQPIRMLGQGGMGRVFLVHDPRLSRNIALKFVRGDDPELARRFVFEARAQARVEHERVCQVYEVGEIEGRVYIAMQYIDGQPLSRLAHELTVEQRVVLLRGAALGVHEAHRAGLIHRDLKPSNILVERTRDELRPYVVDFGLARVVDDPNSQLTITGAVLGTPHYMAPEQARGEVSRLDRRADVYSLGATLYALLTGQPPHPGKSTLEVLNRVATEEPRPPRAIDRDIPADLDAIVMKCLEKDLSARYDSARALAEDLDRFLAGEPVLARSAGLGYRLRKQLRKHARLVAVSAVAVIAVLVALGWAVHERAQAAERERVAQRYTELAENVESMARYSALAPLHDVRADHREIKARMAELEAEIDRAGDMARGPGHYALGRGFLALDELPRAKEYLESAWRQGYRQPRVAYALALVWGRAYQDALLAAERVRDADEREQRKREARASYREPALGYLRLSEGADVPSADYLAALIAFYEGRLDQALGHLDAIGDSLPWFHEGATLRGDIYLARTLEQRNTNQDDEARASLDAGRAAYARAAAIGESVARVHGALGELEYAALVMEMYGAGEVRPPFDRGMAAVGRALAANPEHEESLMLAARFHRSLAEYLGNRGEDVEELLAAGIEYAGRALDAHPGQAAARFELARMYRQWGEHRQARSQDPSKELGKALELSMGIGEADRDHAFHVHLGLLHKIWADYQDQVGDDSHEHRQQAISAYTRAVELEPRKSNAWMNLGSNYFARAEQAGNVEAEADLRRAMDALDRGRALAPQHIVPYFYGGEIHVRLARLARGRGADPGPEIERAIELYRQGLAINAGIPHFHNGTGTAHIEQAHQAWDEGRDPDPVLDQALAAFEQARAVAPEQAYAYNNIGFALAWRAVYHSARGRDPSAITRDALTALDQALERLPDAGGILVNQGMVHAVQAGHELESGRDPTAALARATTALDRALQHNPKDAQAHMYLGEALGIEARYRTRNSAGVSHARVRDLFERAAKWFERGIELSPERHHERLRFGHLCREWASWLWRAGQDPGPALDRGMAQADALLAARPDWPDALVLRASLWVLRADVAMVRDMNPDEYRDLRRRAAGDFARALSKNGNLEAGWQSEARLARPTNAAHAAPE